MTLTQMQQYEQAHRRLADANNAFMECVTCRDNPMTREDLEALIARHPERYGRFAGFLKTLPGKAVPCPTE